jgi:3-deoxy-7-phosphoheptulonate synthase
VLFLTSSLLRAFDAIRAELRAFFDVLDGEGVHPGGMHVEMTGEDVTEVLGGIADITEDDLAKRSV